MQTQPIQSLGHRTLVEAFECPITGLTIEMVRPGRRHKLLVADIVAREWGEREPVDILNPPDNESNASTAYIEYLELWQFVLAAVCMRIRGEDNVIGFARLNELDSDVVELWLGRFLVFTGYLLETAPAKKKARRSHDKSKSSGSRWARRLRRSTQRVR